VLLFLRDLAPAAAIDRVLADELPTSIAGFPTHFGPTEEEGTTRITPTTTRPIAHRVQLLDLGAYFDAQLGFDPRHGVGLRDWLVTPAQRLREMTAGAVFTDADGELTRVRTLLAWYPHDVWLFVMAGLWRRIAQLEHFLGRTGALGDELGTRIVTASLVRDLMRLALVQERQYPPYWKWLGTAYAGLGCAEAPALQAALCAETWRKREDAIVQAYEAVGERHNALAVTEWVEPTGRPFWGRQFRVLFADRFVDALRAAIGDPEVKAIDHNAGSIDSVSDNTDVLTRPSLWRALADLYDRP
jgi:hypothetical protein